MTASAATSRSCAPWSASRRERRRSTRASPIRRNEKSYAGYVQAHYAFGHEGGIRVDGAVGVRYVGTDLSIAGSTVVRGGPTTPLTVGKSYDDWLPNASLRVRFTDELQFRLSATEDADAARLRPVQPRPDRRPDTDRSQRAALRQRRQSAAQPAQVGQLRRQPRILFRHGRIGCRWRSSGAI